MQEPGGAFYITGGTLLADAPSYVERRADLELFEGILKGEFCYVLTSRQMGKSSLMVRTAIRLRERGAHVVALDLTAIGQNLTPEQWYDGLITRMGRQLGLEDELEDFWRNCSRLSPIQRLFAAIRDVALVKRPGPIVIFVDEIDAVKNLPFSTDEFFAAIRECYNRRTEDPEFNRLTFCLLGVATPSDLIRDTRTTPFNIGRRIELDDFTASEAQPLARGLALPRRRGAAMTGKPEVVEKTSRLVMDRILFWTGGHPYLTQQLCRKVAEANADSGAGKIDNARGVDALCQELFLSNRSREKDDNLLFVRERMLRSEVDRGGLLHLYQKIHRHGHSPFPWNAVRDDESNPLVSVLRLAGITRVVRGALRVRNRVYGRVFDRRWAQQNMPNPELRRQREAFWKGLLRGAGIAALLVGGGLAAHWRLQEKAVSDRKALALENFGKIYQTATSYQDSAEMKMEIQMSGSLVETHGKLQLALQKPNRFRVRTEIQMGFTEIETVSVSDGSVIRTYLPSTKRYVEVPATNSLEQSLKLGAAPQGLNPSGTAYTLLFSSDRPGLAQRWKNLRYLRQETFEGQTADVLAYEQLPALEKRDGASLPDTNTMAIPVTVWVSPAGYILRSVIDYTSTVKREMTSAPPGAPRVAVTGMRLTFVHRDIRINPVLPASTFVLEPPADSTKVPLSNLFSEMMGAKRERADITPRYSGKQLAEPIPRRDPQAPSALLDLGPFYNAPLTAAWHGSPAGNNLERLPRGVQVFSGVQFDVRGIIQLAGRGDPGLEKIFPREVMGIKVGHSCKRLHFLHGTGWTSPDGALIGQYRIHYQDGAARIIPIFYGFDVRNWWLENAEPALDNGLTLAWTGSNEATDRSKGALRLYETSWNNPRPEAIIETLDYLSAMDEGGAAPFLIAISTE